MTRSYHTDYIDALAELLQLTQERDSLETKIARQKKRVAALAELISTDDDPTVSASLVEGITDACRTVLRAAERPLIPTEIRDRIQALGFPPQSNLLASVHTVLKRLKDSGEAETFQRADGGETVLAYAWSGRLAMLDAMEKALSTRLPESADGKRKRLVEEIKAVRSRSTIPVGWKEASEYLGGKKK